MDTEKIEICVKIPCFSNKLRFVTINLNEINKNEFVKQSLEVFRVPNNSTDLQVRLLDNRNASIPEQKLAQIMKQFHRSASFFIQIVFVQEPPNDFVPSIVTPEMIRVYIENNGGAAVFEHLDQMQDETVDSAMNELQIDTDNENTGRGILPNHLRIAFVNCLADYTVKLYGSSPTDDRLQNIAHSAVALIPSLASKCSESEIDLLVNKVNGGGGYLYNRLRYLRLRTNDKNKKQMQTVNRTEESSPTADIDNQIVAENSQGVMNNDPVTSDSYQMDDLLFLKTVVVNKQNMPQIQEKLRKTVERRRELLNTENVNMLENFPFMFVCPQLTVDDALPDLHKITNEYPCIVACGEKEDNISRYIIAIDNQPMYVPKEFAFEETVDLFFKMHYVLSLEFDPRLENVFLFMEHFIFKMEGGTKRPYTTMIELSNLVI